MSQIYIENAFQLRNENGVLKATNGLVTSIVGTTSQIIDGTGALQLLTTSIVPEGSNLYFTTARAQASITGSSPISVSSGVVSITQSSATVNGYLSATDWVIFNSKQIALNGTGFVKVTGTTISYDNSTYYLASNPSAYIPLTALTASAPLGYNNVTGLFTISQSSAVSNGYLSSTDWNTFNNKQNALTNPVTGTGTTNYLPKFTGTSTIGNSSLQDDGAGTLTYNAPSSYNATLSLNGSAGNAASVNFFQGGTKYFFVGSDSSANFRINSYTGATFNGVAFYIPTGTTRVLLGNNVTDNGTSTLQVLGGTYINGTLQATGQLTLGSTITNGTYTYTLPSATGTLALVSALSGYVPYTGATTNVNLGSNNIYANAFFGGFLNITASGTQVVLTVLSAPEILVSGSGGQTIKLPDATTLPNGATYSFNNNQTTGAITVNNNSNTLIVSIPSGGYAEVILLDNSIAAGSWDRHFQAPANVSWSTNTFDYAGSITSATWNGTTIAINRGGTGATTAGAALTNLGGIGLTSLSATTPLSYNNTTGAFSIQVANTSQSGYLSSTDWNTFNGKQNALTNPVTGTGTSGQVAYFNGTSTLTSNAAFAFTPTSQLLVNNSVTAASAIARGTNLTPTLTAAANSDVLVGLDINPTFTNGAFTGVTNASIRVQTGNVLLNSTSGNTSIGTIAQAYKLAVLGTIRQSSSNYWVNNGATGLQVEGTSFFEDIVTIKTGKAIYFGGWATQINGTQNTSLGFRANSGSDQMVLFGTGNLAIGTTTDVASSKLTITSTTQGVLFPRLTTTQRDAISSPATGLQVYNTTTNTNDFYNGSAWVSGAISSLYLPLTGGTLTGALNGTSATFSGRVNVNGAVDNSLFSLNTGGTLYTTGFSPNATANSTNTLTLTTAQTTWIYNGSGTASWTLPNPSGTNQMFWIKNAGTGIITLNAYSGTNIINNAAASVSSITIAIGATVLIQQDGNVKSYQLY